MDRAYQRGRWTVLQSVGDGHYWGFTFLVERPFVLARALDRAVRSQRHPFSADDSAAFFVHAGTTAFNDIQRYKAKDRWARAYSELVSGLQRDGLLAEEVE